MMDDWKTLALYVAVGLFIAVTLWRWHTGARYRDFSMVDLIAEDGKISSRKFMEFGAWVTATIAIVTMTIGDKLTVEYFTAYVGVFVIGRVGGQALHTYQATTTRKAEIVRGRRGDIFADESDPPNDESGAQLERPGLKGDRR